MTKRMACANDIPNLRKCITKENDGFSLLIMKDFVVIETIVLKNDILKDVDFYTYFGQRYLETRDKNNAELMILKLKL